MTDLEQQLRDLGQHLDHPAGERMVLQLRSRLSTPGTGAGPRPQWPRRRAVATVIASLAAVLLLAIAIPPSRDAIADLLGLGSHEVGRPDRVAVPHQGPPVTGAPSVDQTASSNLESARQAVDFPIRVPGHLDATPQVTVDRSVPGGLVALSYPSFTLVEVASPPNVAAELAQLVAPESHVRIVAVRGRPGLWITGTHHQVPYLDRDGMLRFGSSRPTGHVLLWEEDGVTYRVEGFAHQASASEIASTID
jgi:hypothetical protein